MLCYTPRMDRWYTAVEGVWDRSFGRIFPSKKNQEVKKKPWWRIALETFVFAVVAITLIWNYLFQIFQIPSGSMESTLLIGDKVVVWKSFDGPALVPGWHRGPHLPSLSSVEYDDIIPFVSKSYYSRGPLFELFNNAVLLATLSKVNLDKVDGRPQVRDLVKRVAVPSNMTAHFRRGELELELPGGVRMSEKDYKAARKVKDRTQRLVRASAYDARERILWYLALKREGLAQFGPTREELNALEQALRPEEQRLDPVSIEERGASYYAQLRPDDSKRTWVRALAGTYVPEGMILPLGDNRDNSYDGRRYGPLPKSAVMGEILFRFAPLSRFGGVR